VREETEKQPSEVPNIEACGENSLEKTLGSVERDAGRGTIFYPQAQNEKRGGRQENRVKPILGGNPPAYDRNMT